MLRHALACWAVNVPVKVEEATLGHMEEGPECGRLFHFPLDSESVGVNIVQLRIIRGEQESLDRSHYITGYD
jgi:hypothetical protein